MLKADGIAWDALAKQLEREISATVKAISTIEEKGANASELKCESKYGKAKVKLMKNATLKAILPGLLLSDNKSSLVPRQNPQEPQLKPEKLADKVLFHVDIAKEVKLIRWPSDSKMEIVSVSGREIHVVFTSKWGAKPIKERLYPQPTKPLSTAARAIPSANASKVVPPPPSALPPPQ
ncbi:hypothetical protein AAMO2058_000855400 [Amorphochlora amoebiformis]